VNCTYICVFRFSLYFLHRVFVVWSSFYFVVCRVEDKPQLRGLKGLFSLPNLKNLLVGIALAVAFQLTGTSLCFMDVLSIHKQRKSQKLTRNEFFF
jgi:hypothetical protein